MESFQAVEGSAINPPPRRRGGLGAVTSGDVVHYLSLLLVLLLGAYLRFQGLDWDERSHPHPDERFLTMVESALDFQQGVRNYFDTANSRLNPNNVGYGFFVYGTLPIFIVRMLAEAVDKTGYDQVHLVGRTAAASFDMLSLLLVYLIGRVLYRRQVGLLAAAFAAFSVLLIQHAHFFVVDPFANTFILLGVLAAVLAMKNGRLLYHALFGLALGAAAASKIDALSLALVLVLADGVFWLRSEREGRGKLAMELFFRLCVAAAISLVAFRIFQPYAFQGPTFFHILLNPQWLANMREIRFQLAGQADFPPALQWVDRPPIWFSFKNLVLWGLGLPLGILAWLGWAWAAARIVIRREWQHTPLVVWMGLYFLWRSTGFTVSMRYLLPIYPVLAILAAWALWRAWAWGGSLPLSFRRPARALIGLTGAGILGYTALYAFGFAQIYQRPNTQVAASRWIYSHIPSGVNLRLAGAPEGSLEPLPIPTRLALMEGVPLELPYTASSAGALKQIKVRLISLDPQAERSALRVELLPEGDGPPLAAGTISPESAEGELLIGFADPSVALQRGAQYRLRFSLLGAGRMELAQEVEVTLEGPEDEYRETLRLPRSMALLPGDEYPLAFTARHDGQLAEVVLPYAQVLIEKGLELQVDLTRAGEKLATGGLQLAAGSPGERRLVIPLEQGPALQAGERYELVLRVLRGALRLRGSYLISETTWDLGLPFRIDGRDGFGGYYQGLNLELYWSDTQDDDGDGLPDKYERIRDMLQRGDYLIISTNRQYGSITRVPSRYPLTTAYYRALFDCPPPRTVSECAARAEPGQLQNKLGYELVAVFTSYPRLLGWELNDQLAEEVFTVYDHPKVLIFAKGEDFSPQRIEQILGAVDVSAATLVEGRPPKELKADPRQRGGPAPTPKRTLMLPEDRWRAQQASGTWSQLFNRQWLINRWQPLTVVLWYGAIALIGLLALPITWRAFSGLTDRGYPLARLVGLLLVAWGSWFVGSLGLEYSRQNIAALVLLMASLSLWVARGHWSAFKAYLRSQRKAILWSELLFLAFFLLDLGIRAANPDLWHPFKGGEKPMDFAYLNAVLKSISFPPYDPWFAGGYINYYYFGFVLVGTPIKLLGVVPAVAYNLVLPTLFALLAAGAYCFGANLLNGRRTQEEGFSARALLAGLGAAAAILLLGNLGSLRLLYEGLRVVGGGSRESPGLVVGLVQAVAGLLKYLRIGGDFPVAFDRWYWDPSRAIRAPISEAGPITEFPLFTFIYGDLHAHMINMPLTVAVLVWALAWLKAAQRRACQSLGDWLAAMLMGAVLLGALRPTNTWDFPVYWALAALAAVAAALLRHQRRLQRDLRPEDAGLSQLRALAEGILAPLVLLGLAYLLYRPYSLWYVQAYSAVELWKGSKTSLEDYFVVHGVFLFFLISWMAWETVDWMKSTPLAALNRLRPHGLPLAVGALLFGLLVLGLGLLGYAVALVALPLGLWVAVLLLRPGLALEKRVVLLMAGSGLALTMLVEVVVLKGDISRMNTVFKFYLQVWTLFALSAAASGFWLLESLHRWRPRLRTLWSLSAGGLLFAGAMFLFTAVPAKLRDRMAPEAPRGLDGMAYMAYAEYGDIGGTMSLDQDYRAIRWMQDNVVGTPVIVEGTAVEYRWGSRYSIYTGLPTVLGWNWHQRQQRGVAGDQSVYQRANDVAGFYMTRSIDQARAFLDKYQVDYVVVGQMERNYFARAEPCRPVDEGDGVLCEFNGWPVGMPNPEVRIEECQPLDPQAPAGPFTCPTFGIQKLEQMVALGDLRVAYQEGETVIYQVVR